MGKFLRDDELFVVVESHTIGPVRHAVDKRRSFRRDVITKDRPVGDMPAREKHATTVIIIFDVDGTFGETITRSYSLDHGARRYDLAQTNR